MAMVLELSLSVQMWQWEEGRDRGERRISTAKGGSQTNRFKDYL